MTTDMIEREKLVTEFNQADVALKQARVALAEYDKKQACKFKVGSIWLHKYNKDSFKVFRVTQVDEMFVHFYVLYLKGVEGAAIRMQINSTTARKCIPFYAPPTEEQLDKHGERIEGIKVLKKGDRFFTAGRLFATEKTLGVNNLNYDGSEAYQGYRYILESTEQAKPKWKLVELDVDTWDNIRGYNSLFHKDRYGFRYKGSLLTLSCLNDFVNGGVLWEDENGYQTWGGLKSWMRKPRIPRKVRIWVKEEVDENA